MDTIKPLNHFGVITCVNSTHLSQLTEFPQNPGVESVFVIDGTLVCSKETFLAQAENIFPQRSGLTAHDNWDAFCDWLWDEFAQLGAAGTSQIAIIWTDVQNMLEGGLPALLTAVSCFQHLSTELVSVDHGFPRPMGLHLFLVGTGPNFPPL